MKIIAIEGLDKSGKYTASTLLAERLLLDGYRVVQSEFHRYDTPTGELIAKWLCGEWDVDQLTIELVMAADKQAQQQWFQELEESGNVDVLILDRYTASQMVYSQANGVDLEWASRLQDHMRQPDHEILIDIPAEVSMARKGKHNNGENDRYESDLELLKDVRKRYIDYIQPMLPEFETPDNLIVDGQKSIDNIHEDIYRFVSQKL